MSGAPAGGGRLNRTTCSGLTYAETAKDMGWNYRVMATGWAGRYALVLNPGVNGVYLLRTNLDAAFDDNGQQAIR
jgi:hypothetical protein